MSRNTTPKTRGSNYITVAGMQALKDELEYLWRRKRPEVTRAVAEAAAMGDRSENAEYIYGKKQLREIDRKVRYLRQRIECLQVVKELPSTPDRVYFGAWVDLNNDIGESCCYRIVGPDEFDLAKGWISLDSPMAQALMGRQIGDVIYVKLDSSTSEWVVKGIRYQLE